MNYYETRDAEQLRLLTPAIDAFIAKYLNPPVTASACPRQTVFFFPGGMASQLQRARSAFVEGLATPQTFAYDTAWLAASTVFLGWWNLKMHKDGANGFRDEGDHIVVADGEAVCLLGASPHSGFASWCANNNTDLFVFGWDWRRRLDETATFFVSKFLPYFRTRVMNAGGADPLATFSLVGHSLGGMVVNQILRSNDPLLASMKSAITVATPFYGYAGQMHRWFEGEPLLLEYWGALADLLKQPLIEVISSFPGLYTVLFLDEATYGTSAISNALTNDVFPLNAYPSRDKTAPAINADPYNPQAGAAGRVRYPTNTGFDLLELAYAKTQFQQLAGAMVPSLAQRFFHLRGIVTQADNVTPLNNTVGSVSWDWIRPTYDSVWDPSPITDGPFVPGDDTQPAWSARLASNAVNCRDIKDSSLDHAFLMNHQKTLDQIKLILCAPGVAVNPPTSAPPRFDPASHEDVIKFLRWLFKHRRRIKRWPHFNEEALRKALPSDLRRKVRGIGMRIMQGLMRGPTASLPAPKPGKPKPKPRPGGSKRPRKPKQRETVKKKK